jgi:hypothetical protein
VKESELTISSSKLPAGTQHLLYDNIFEEYTTDLLRLAVINRKVVSYRTTFNEQREGREGGREEERKRGRKEGKALISHYR